MLYSDTPDVYFNILTNFLFSSGRNGDALVNCYDTQSVVATGRYYRFKRDGNYTSQPEDLKVPEAPAAVVTEVKEAETQTKTEEKKE